MRMSEPNKKQSVDLRFIMGFVLIIFLVLVHTTIGEIPLYLIAVPTLIMGVDISAIIKAWRGKDK